MRIIMIRHAEAECNTLQDDSLIETYDSACELTEHGLQQARMLKEHFPLTLSPTIIFTSPYKRAKATAEIFRQRFSVPLMEDRRLEELRAPSRFDPPISQLQWDLLLKKRIYHPNVEITDGLESLREQSERLSHFLKELILRYGHDSNQNIVIFTHAFCIQLSLLFFMKLDSDHLLNLEFKVSNASIHVVNYINSEQIFLIENLNNKSHLEKI